jgi:hypothetical protein
VPSTPCTPTPPPQPFELQRPRRAARHPSLSSQTTHRPPRPVFDQPTRGMFNVCAAAEGMVLWRWLHVVRNSVCVTRVGWFTGSATAKGAPAAFSCASSGGPAGSLEGGETSGWGEKMRRAGGRSNGEEFREGGGECAQRAEVYMGENAHNVSSW